ncbi:acyl-CoA synthetase (AMP-forming)/AMP-acid ligase II [Actinoplanes lutulentus]|uniref:Acyl-CoA synthetase (AMP-forming)/AMP-acid ligase II n=1 Tax=Actinoplanes lutulentus TaxID=1287878 RepID=A0A327Z7M2_9ACTN|nr:AMP-binding protein [Actinoplanes lutulentus]MBB2945176.1 acyl-CoA synthetase (AMP-forming)/AMP-acid ligase II [Actinoplanes lutulentus]RAK31972.1 acyl-CoA synthetase (AMP-forming)/AMP-acid ligase II [Actinoplanes lutulentus]
MNLLHPDARVIDAVTGESLTPSLIDRFGEELADQKLVFLPMPTTIEAIAKYLAALRLHKPVVLLDPDADHAELIARYQADEVHPDLALLLTTSGSTGNPKLVRLSRSAVLANAEQVAESLGVTSDDVAITTLPLFYSYGLSVLHSHLLRGATVVLERTGLMQRDFWTAVDAFEVTSLAFVPYQYEMLRRLRFDPAKHPSVRTLTQAGGRLRAELITEFSQKMDAAGGRLFVMYGQTEAAPRMATLPPDRIADKIGSVGLAMPGASFAIEDDEVVYRGPNVMMGYAESGTDLAAGDQLGGVLRTGDLGRLDDEGFLFITGRLKRMGKVFGVRINLDDVERNFPITAVAGDDKLHVFAEDISADDARALRTKIAEWLGTHFSGVDVRSIEALPLLPNGKTDYRALEASL